jgi:hypothetical protein
MTVASSSEIYLFSFPLAALSCSESAGVQGRARSRHSCHIRGKSRWECRASIGSRTYLRPRTFRPPLVSALFSHCFARTICQSPSIVNILHLSVMHNSDISQLLSWLAKSLDLTFNYFFLQAPKLPCASNHLGDDARVRHPSPPLTAPSWELPRLNWYPTTATLLTKTWTLHAVASRSGICTWRLSALALRCITRAKSLRRHRLFDYPSQSPTQLLFDLESKSGG